MRDNQIAPPARRYLTDVVVLGCGAPGLLAALRARRAGLEVTVLDVGDARDENLLWIPESYHSARNYLDQVLGDATVEQSQRRHDFLLAATSLPQLLAEFGVGLAKTKIRATYPRLSPAANARGWRVISTENFWTLANAVIDSSVLKMQFLSVAAQEEVSVWSVEGLEDLVWRDGRVIGLRVRRAGTPIIVEANFGVVLASGGFGQNVKLRRRFLPGTRADRQLEVDGDGCVIEAAVNHGLDLGAMARTWSSIGMQDPLGEGWVDATEAIRAGHSMLVDSAGLRFCDESEPPEMLAERFEKAWLVFDSAHRKTVPLGSLKPGHVPRKAAENGRLRKAKSLEELARVIRAPRLTESVKRFNAMADAGNDLDFGRDWQILGNEENAGIRGRLTQARQSLGSLARRGNGLTNGPFYAVEIRPCDAGTKGGIIVDSQARALRGGEPVPGLYAIGSAAASICELRSPATGTRATERLCGAAQIAF